MILFLTSSPCDDNVPAHMHLPCCYFEKNDFVKNMKKYWKQNSRCLIIAADPYNFDLNNEMAYTFHRAFLYHGMIPEFMKLCDARNDYHIKDLVADSDMIILAGGHVPTELKFFQDLGLAELLKDYKGMIMGISAGSMNSASEVYIQPEEPGESIDPEFKRHGTGLGLTKYQILPHYQKVRDSILDGKRLFEDIIHKDSVGQEFYALVDSSYIMQNEDGATLYGEAYRIKDDQVVQICEEGKSMKLK